MKSLISRIVGRGRAAAQMPTTQAPTAPIARQAQSTDSYINIAFRPLADTGVEATDHRGTVSYRVGPETRVAFSVWDGPSVAALGIDLFATMTDARRQLESAGYLPLIAGARRDCYPSGMARNMGEGDMAYRLTEGQFPTLDDLVWAFDPADPAQVTTVAAQEAAFSHWAASLPEDHGDAD